jgi:uncharacterized membrane protein
MIEQRGETGALSLHRKPQGANVGGVERGVSALAGAALLVEAVRRRSPSALAVAAALGGAALVARGATGYCPVYGGLGIGTARRPGSEHGLVLMRSITIGGTPDAIADAARETSRWLPDAVALERDAPGRWRAALRLPGGRRLESELEAYVEDDGTFAWRSAPDARVEHQGRVFFGPAPDPGATEVRVVVSVRPGTRWLRPVAERALGHGLRRLAQLVEAHEVATADARPPRRAMKRAAPTAHREEAVA